jgi:hypothetical protein
MTFTNYERSSTIDQIVSIDISQPIDRSARFIIAAFEHAILAAAKTLLGNVLKPPSTTLINVALATLIKGR